ncbi:MAG: hypothetical protein J2P54_10695 [Bradyrhizobiaceae bacterium]|nr:hypothetical protein [Bradyrhizobiaceae bacterium]
MFRDEALLFPRRHCAAAVTASLLMAGAVLLVPAPAARAQPLSANCEDTTEVAALTAPIAPWKGAPLRVLIAAERALPAELLLIAPDGSVAVKSRERHGGPPYFWFGEVAAPTAGTWHATLVRDGTPAGCGRVTRDVIVSAQKPLGPHANSGSLWPVRNSWNRATENLYSAWISKLFDAPLETEPSWKAWHEVLRDPSRNFLFNYLGLDEDNVLRSLRPDCADFVYFLRAYFAFNMGLPFGYSNCSRGAGGAPPKCFQWFDIEHPEVTRPAPAPEANAASGTTERISFAPTAPALNPPAKQLGLAASFAQYLRAVGDVVHSGSVRVSAADDNTDFYTVPLTQATLRPGTVYADPYGHVLMLVKRVPEVNGAPGVFLAVDAEPDGTVTRKRFWRGNFLFAHEPSLGSPGFKRFRPIVRANNDMRRMTNAEIANDPGYRDFSLEQSRLTAEEFYDRMDEAMSPEPLDPSRAMEDAITSLDEQVKTRVVAVELGRKFQNSGHGDANMPNGAAIFQTNGPWEDFSTPARDFRLLIAIDVVRGFPDRVARRPERYAIPIGKSAADVKAELQRVLASELSVRKLSYMRSDGSQWTLSLKDVVDRADDLEMAYNPNDCVELRWGAPPESEEASTCKRHAPAAQHAKMTEYRSWFRDRHWPHT